MVVDCEKSYNPLLLLRRSVPHVVVFPFPAQGHIRPFLQFSKTLVAEYDMDVTFVTTAPHLDRCRRALLQVEEDARFKAHSRNNIQLVCLEMPAESGKTTGFVGMERTARNLRDIFAEVMKGLVMAASSSSSSFVGTIKNPPGSAPPTTHHFGPPSCIISDMFLGWTQNVADEFKVPRYCLAPCATHFISFMLRLPEWNAQGRIPVPVEIDGEPYTIPGLPPIAPLEMDTNVQGDKEGSEALLYHAKCLWRAAGVLVNSVFKLEASIIEGLQDVPPHSYQGNQVPRILTVGPFLEGIGNQASGGKPQVAEVDNECLQWLSKQSGESVLYICFGTITAHGREQINEIALGLESSGAHFLWVVSVPTDEKGTIVDVAKLLPKGFLERTKDRGLVYFSWAPQLQILAHPAIKGFLTHCGWNSTMESIAMGVPMIAWPNHADQMVNCRLCVEILNIAIPVQKTGEASEIIGQNEVKRVVQLFMEDVEIFHALKTNVQELSKVMGGAHACGGSSKVNLDLFVDELNSMTLIKL